MPKTKRQGRRRGAGRGGRGGEEDTHSNERILDLEESLTQVVSSTSPY